MIVISTVIIAFLLVLLGWNYFQLLSRNRIFFKEREEREAILASLSDGVLECDDKGRIILMNPKAAEFFGVDFKEISGIDMTPDIWDIKPEYRALVEVIHPELAPNTISRGGDSFSSEKGLEIHTSRPEMKLFVISRTIKNHAGKAIGHVKIIRDISHEELLGKIKSEFVSVAAHQLRTPLAALKWSIRLLLDGDIGRLEPKHIEFLSRSYDITERMIKLVNDLLDAARIEEGRFGYEFKEIDYVNFMEKLLKNYEISAKAANIEIVFRGVEGLIPPIYADPERLSVAMSNLIENALHYTKARGKITVGISKEGDYVKTAISDTGVGIPKDEQKRVFSKFFRASNAIKLETEGTGLGLFIVRNIIKRHGGDVKFTSEEGKGTAFTVSLPLRRDFVPGREKPAVEEFLEGV